MKLSLVTFALIIAVCLITSTFSIAATVFYTNFNSGVPAEFTGVITTESVQGFNGFGTGSNVFSGDFLRNTTGGTYSNPGLYPGSPTILTLTGLPDHVSISLDFLLAILDSWDGSLLEIPDNLGGPDYFNVKIDGNLIFSETFFTFNSYGSPQSYNPPPGGLLTAYSNIFNGAEWFYDNGYDMGFESRLHDIPHTSSNLVIEWFANGGGWQGGSDESWAIDNVEVSLNGSSNPVPEPSTILLINVGLISMASYAGMRSIRKKS